MKWQENEFFDRVCQRNQLVFPELRVFGRILARVSHPGRAPQNGRVVSDGLGRLRHGESANSDSPRRQLRARAIRFPVCAGLSRFSDCLSTYTLGDWPLFYPTPLKCHVLSACQAQGADIPLIQFHNGKSWKDWGPSESSSPLRP